MLPRIAKPLCLVIASFLLMGAAATPRSDSIPPPPDAALEQPPTIITDQIVNESDRGKLLYENHCQACHTSMAHVREKRQAKSRLDIVRWVIRWSTEQKLPWGTEEVENVVDYLNATYYKFPDSR